MNFYLIMEHRFQLEEVLKQLEFMRKIILLSSLLIVYLSFSQENNPKLDSLMKQFALQKGIDKAETSKNIGSYFKKIVNTTRQLNTNK